MFLNILGASDIHISLKAEPIFQLGPITVTNAMIYGVVCSVIISLILIFAAKRIHEKPRKGFSQIIEIITEFVLDMLEGVFGQRSLAVKYAPIFGAFFFFIILNNLLALIPLVGPGLTVNVDGTHTPLFRPFTADLNGTIALAVIAIVIVQVQSVKAQGGRGHLKHYFSDKPYNPVNFFIGVLEVFGEFTRILSLSLRLFLNTAVGEILIAVFTSLVAANGRTPLAVIPILLFEVLVAGIQAYVFTVLSATYLGLAITHAHEDSHHEPSVGHLASEPSPKPGDLSASEADFSLRSSTEVHQKVHLSRMLKKKSAQTSELKSRGFNFDHQQTAHKQVEASTG